MTLFLNIRLVARGIIGRIRPPYTPDAYVRNVTSGPIRATVDGKIRRAKP